MYIYRASDEWLSFLPSGYVQVLMKVCGCLRSGQVEGFTKLGCCDGPCCDCARAWHDWEIGPLSNRVPSPETKRISSDFAQVVSDFSQKKEGHIHFEQTTTTLRPRNAQFGEACRGPCCPSAAWCGLTGCSAGHPKPGCFTGGTSARFCFFQAGAIGRE